MNLATNGVLMISAAMMTLAGIHLRMCFDRRLGRRHMLFVASALSMALFALFERAMMQAETPAEFEVLTRWIHVVAGPGLIFTGLFMRTYMPPGRDWLLWSVVILRAIAFVLNFTSPVSLNYLEIISITKVPFFGEMVSIPVGVPNPLMIIGQASIFLLVIYCVDAAVGIWRRGYRGRALTIGGSFVVFSLTSFAASLSSFWGLVQWPLFASPGFLGILAAMGFELTRDLQRAAQLSHDLTESKALLDESVQRLNLSADAANVGIWTRKAGKMVIEASPKWNKMFGFEPSQTVTREQFRSRIHPDDLEMVVGHTTAAEDLGHDFDYEFRIVLPSGEVRWMASSGKVQLAGGKPYILRGASVDITNRKLAEESTKDLAAIVQSSDDAIYRKTLDGVVTTWNGGAERIFGYAAAEIIGQNVSTLAPDDRQDEVIEIRTKLRRGEPVDHLETERVTKDGRRINVSITVSPIKDRTGKVIGSSTSARDITTRKLAEEAARKSEERNRTLVRALPDLVFVLTADGVIIDFNANDPRDLLVPPAEFLGKGLSDVFPPDLADRLLQCVERTVRNREPQTVEYMLSLDGNERWFEARMVQGEDGQVLSVVRDITDRKIAEAQLKDSQAELAGLVGSALDAIIFINEDRKIVLFNRAAERTLKITADEAMGEPLDRFIPERFRAAYGDAISEFGKTGEMHRLPTPLYGRRATGEDFPLEASFSHVEVNGRSFFTVIIRDITARYQAQQLLQERAHLLAESQRIAHVGSWTWDMANDLTWTDETYRIYGVSRETFAPTVETLLELIHPDDRPHLQRWIEDCSAGVRARRS